jgi:hypothetical protein
MSESTEETILSRVRLRRRAGRELTTREDPGPTGIPDPAAFTGTDLGLLRLVRLRGLLFPDAWRLEHPSHWKNTLP